MSKEEERRGEVAAAADDDDKLTMRARPKQSTVCCLCSACFCDLVRSPLLGRFVVAFDDVEDFR